MKKVISTKEAPSAIGPYSQAIKANGFLFLSGQIPLSPATGELVGSDIKEQTHQVFANIKGVLQSEGLTLADVVKATVFLASIEDFQAVNEVYGEYFTNEPPARSCFQVVKLPKDAGVEIEVIAVYN